MDEEHFIVVEMSEESLRELEKLAARHKVPATALLGGALAGLRHFHKKESDPEYRRKFEEATRHPDASESMEE